MNATRALSLLGLLVICPAASADSMTATLGMPLTETAHVVEVTIADGLATFEVERTFHNAGKRADEVQLMIDLPPGAVANGLRIHAEGVWYEGDLLPAEEAAQRYQELTGMGAFQLKDPALLAWVNDSTLSLQLFPVKGGQSARVAYTLVAPAEYHDGRYHVRYPERTSAQLAVPSVRGDARSKIARRIEVLEEASFAMCGGGGGPTHFAVVSVAPPYIPIVASRYGTLDVAADRRLWRLEVDAAPHIGEIPKQAHVVLVLDGSRSQGPDGVAAQAALARAYLSHYPSDVAVEVVWVDRRARVEHGRFVSKATAMTRLAAIARRPFETQNGSALEVGLGEAARLLANVSGARRVVLMHDARVASELTNDAAIAALRRAGPERVDGDLVLHVIIRGPEDHNDEPPTESREDEHALAPLAAAFGGMLGYVNNTGKPKDLAAAILPYARPTRIDNFLVDPAIDRGLGDEVPTTFLEGSALRAAGLGGAPETVRMTGMIWGRAWQAIVRPEARHTSRTAALVFGDGQHWDLSPEEQMKAARVGGVVSPVTSYLAIEPGVRPSTEGLPEASGGFGCLGDGTGGGAFGSGRSGRGHFEDPNPGFLQVAAEAAASACGASHPRAALRIDVEVTSDEIVALRADAQSAFGACVVEQLWAAHLPSDYVERATHQVVVR